MSRVTRRQLPGRQGFALPTVMIFAFILLIAGMSFFAIASYETKGALYREGSSEAFYLADGAIERARAKFLEDRTWRDGWTAVPAGRGTYDLRVTDTTWAGFERPVHLVATGHVLNANRRVDVIADVPTSAFDLPLLVMGDAEIGGNLCLNGDAHVNGDATGGGGSGDPHFVCGGAYTEGFDIEPPPIYTDPGHFPNGTYYYVRGTQVGGYAHATVYNGLGVDITAATGDLADVTTYNNAQRTYTFSFDNGIKIAKYFDEVTGAFRPLGGDVAAVVNFGEMPLDPPLALAHSLIFDGPSANIHATILNSRFLGATDTQRIDYRYWDGWDDASDSRRIEIKQVTFEPYLGIAMITENLEKTGTAAAVLGTAAWPALVYVTKDIVTINSSFNLLGSLIVLNDFHSTGGPTITYDEGFMDNIPDYLRESWPSEISGTLKVIRWSEIAASPN